MIEHFLMALLVTQPAKDGTAQPGAAPPEAVVIQAPQAQLLGKENRATYWGGVTVQRGSAQLKCERLVAFLDPSGGQRGPRRVECEGQVQARDGDRTASGERATFDNVAGVLEVTGTPEARPEARQGPHVLRGRLVRFLVGTDRLEVEQAETVLQAASRLRGGKGAGKGAGKAEAGPPVRVSAPQLRVYNREGRAVYSGGVSAVRGRTELRCRRATASYTPGDTAGQVRRVECVGEVEARDGDRWARGERALYDNAAGTLVLTGNPELHQGAVNVTRGKLVRLYVDTDTVEVEQPESVLDPSSAKAARGDRP